MVVRGLASFIMKDFRHWKAVNKKGRVIVDGNSICYFLNKDIPWALGGEYDKFASEVGDFFATYFRNPIVVLEASRRSVTKYVAARAFSTLGTSMLEMKTVQKSYMIDTSSTGPGKPCPSLIIRTFIATLEKLNIEYHVADGDTSKRIAALANEHKCPVLSADSDFFIFDLRYGFVHLDKLLSSARPLYYIDDFMKQFKLKAYELCLMIPAYFGNGFIKPAEPCVRLRHSIYRSFIDKLSKCRTCTHFKHSTSQGRKINFADVFLALQFYSEVTVNTSFAIYTPRWLYKKYKEGKFSAVLFEAYLRRACLQPQIVETIQCDSAWNASRFIRQHIYCILKLDEVAEMARLSGKDGLKLELVHPVSQSIPSSVESVPLESVLCCLLRTEDIPNEFSQLDDEWKLPIAATCFWYKKVFNPRLLLALLLSFLTLHKHASRQNFGCPVVVVGGKKAAYLEALHAYAKWQCVYSDAISLNSLAVEPMHIINPAQLYSGEIAMGYALRHGLLQRGSGPMMELLHSFWTIITGTDLPTSNYFAD